MSFAEKAYYRERVIERADGKKWRYRIEFFPYHFVSGYVNYTTNDYEPEWVQFTDEQMIDIKSEISSKFNELIPVGLPSARSVKFSVNLSAFSSEGVESIRQINRSQHVFETMSPNSRFDMLNLWIIRTDYGNNSNNYTVPGLPGTIPGAPCYFIGLQKLPGTTESKLIKIRDGENLKFVELFEIEAVEAMFEVNRQFKIEWLGDALLQYDSDAIPFRKYNASIYDIVKRGNVWNSQLKSWNYGLIAFKEYNEPLRAITMSFGDIRTIYSKYVNMYLRYLRVQKNRFPNINCDGFLNYPYLKFYTQYVQFYPSQPIANDNLHIIVGSAYWTGTEYIRAYGGLFERGDKSGQLFDGETISDMLQNLAHGFAHKILYRNLEIRSTGLWQSPRYEDNYLTYPAFPLDVQNDTVSDSVTIGTGENANNVRSFIYNIDIEPGEKNVTTYSSVIKGNQTENDYEKRCVLHNVSRLADYSIASDSTLNATNRVALEIRGSLYLRRLFVHSNIDGYLFVSDPNKVHDYVQFAVMLNESDTSSPKNPLWNTLPNDYQTLHNDFHEYANGESNGNGAYNSMLSNYINNIQLHSGLPFYLSHSLSLMFPSDNMFMLTIDVPMTNDINSYRIGEMFKVVMPDVTSYSDLHNKRTILYEVSDDLFNGVSKIKLLGVK